MSRARIEVPQLENMVGAGKKKFVFDKRFYTELDSEKLKVLGIVRNDFYNTLFAIVIADGIDETKIPVNKIAYAKISPNSDYLNFDLYAQLTTSTFKSVYERNNG